jgi:hypothetical protein
MTPKGGPGSVRTPADFSASVASPADGAKPPSTPKSVPPAYPVPSPYPAEKKPEVKCELDEPSNAHATSGASSFVSSAVFVGGMRSEVPHGDHVTETLTLKRPRLPLKEYEAGLDMEASSVSDSIYDTEYLQHWLNHPVKKFRPSELKSEDPLRPMYRRASQAADSPKRPEMGANGDDGAMPADHVSDSDDVSGRRQAAVKSEPFDFADGSDIKKENKVKGFFLLLFFC